MKEVVLTGISNDIDINGANKGRFYLVFNNGQLRIPVNEEAIETVLKFRQNLTKTAVIKEAEPIQEQEQMPYEYEDEQEEEETEEDNEYEDEAEEWDASPPSEDDIPSI